MIAPDAPQRESFLLHSVCGREWNGISDTKRDFCCVRVVIVVIVVVVVVVIFAYCYYYYLCWRDKKLCFLTLFLLTLPQMSTLASVPIAALQTSSLLVVL